MADTAAGSRAAASDAAFLGTSASMLLVSFLEVGSFLEVMLLLGSKAPFWE